MSVKRLRKYTGKIYENDKIVNMQECRTIINDLDTEAELEYLHSRNKIDCLFCPACPGCCPEKMKAIENGG